MNGLDFVVGGYQRITQHYNITIAQLLCSLLLLAFLSLMIPTVSSVLAKTSSDGVVRQSRGTAIMLLSAYALWLIFQFKTHREIFNPDAAALAAAKKIKERRRATKLESRDDAMMTRPQDMNDAEDEIDEDPEIPQLSTWTAIGVIIIFTVLLAFNTQFATNSINGLLNQAGLSTTFVGLVILPLLNNDPTTLKTAYIDKMDLSIALTIGKCMQTALLVIPLVILIAWPMGVGEMTLSFESFEIVSLFASILIVSFITQNGESTW